MRTANIIRWGLTGAALVALVAWSAITYVVPMFETNVSDRMGHGDYVLATTDGAAFTEATLKGAPSAVFFGFTHCPEVCPTTLGDVYGWKEDLADKGEDIRVFFVTVDPERDTQDVLGDYVGWVPGVTGVTGDPAEIQKAIKSFYVYAAKVPLEDGGYTMDHSASVLLFDKDGVYQEAISYREDPEVALAKLNRVIRP
ncbi:SCO family protein [uncultured Maritimibacter sp.]|jgi:protein SCO1/2|uniref:SCO family protein n=1 Tax=uncultured Maritimibacter sp. TaxID=991866 RepID=UPI000AD2AB6E|nr:SCO family protein [uncultured Maritimibacter sp.]